MGLITGLDHSSLKRKLSVMGQVSVPLGRTEHESMGGAITSRSLDEASSWKAVGRFVQERLVMRLTPAKRMEADGLGVEIDLAANEAMGPKGVYPEGATQQAHGTSLRTVADEDERANRVRLQIRLPGRRERPPCGSRLDTGGRARAVGVDIAPGTLLEGSERRVVEASPDLGLPATVEVSDGSLESALLGRREDRGNPQLQAGSHDAAEGILTVMAPLKDGVVVELGIGGQPEFSPVFQQGFHGGLRGHQRLRPRARQAALQRDDVKDLKAQATFQSQPLDGVEAVEFGAPLTPFGKIPARWGRRAPHAAPAIQGTSSLEDAANGPHRGHDNVLSRSELTVDRLGSVLAQITRLLELASQDQHEILYRRLGSTTPPRNGRMVAPIDMVQGTVPGTSEPPLHGGEADVMSPRHRSYRGALSNCRYHLASPLLSPPKPFLPIASHPRGFSASIATERYWHLTDREVVAPSRCYVPADKMIVSVADHQVLLHEFKHHFEGTYHQ